MTAIKETPVCHLSTKISAHKGNEELELLASLKSRQQKFLSYIVKEHPEQVNLISNLHSCAQRVYFRHYENGERRYAGGCTCKRYLDCPPCNHRRAVTASETYGASIRKIMSKGNLWPFRIRIISDPSPDPVAQAVHLNSLHNALRAVHNGKKTFPGGILAYSFQAVPEGFQGILTSILLVDLRKLSDSEGPSAQVEKIILQTLPDLVFSVHPLAEESLVDDLWATFNAVGLRPDPAIPHAKRWEFNRMISRYQLLRGFGILSGIALHDSSEPTIPGLSSTGELNVYRGDYTFNREVDFFPLEHCKRSSCTGSGKIYRRFCNRRWQSILQRFSHFGIEPGDDLPATPSELMEFRIANSFSKRTLARWSGFSRYLIKQWEKGNVLPPPFAGALYLLYVAQRHEVTA